MITEELLNSWFGKSMTDICLNGYDNTTHNHCAHFVAHAMNLHFGYTCQNHHGGQSAGANLRVHEIFAECPRKEEINQCTTELTGLIFVSGTSNFRTSSGSTTLNNVPRKHIGVIHNGHVWHYGNTVDQVVRQPMSDFLFHYRNQENALWYGTLPANARPIYHGQC